MPRNVLIICLKLQGLQRGAFSRKCESVSFADEQAAILKAVGRVRPTAEAPDLSKHCQGVMKVFRLIVWFYVLFVFLAVSCAWYFDIRLLNSSREHMLPDFLLMFVTLPASLSLGPLYESFPTFFDWPFAQLTWITLCGVGQASVLFVAENLVSRKQKHISKP